jgi:integrase
MGRPGLAVGTAGATRIYPITGGFAATVRFRDFDGTIRQVKRHGSTRGAASRSLAAAIRDRSNLAHGANFNLDTRVEEMAEVWFAALQNRDLSPSTIQLYRDRLDRQVIPKLGRLKLRELTVGVIDRHLSAVKASHGPSLAKTTRSVLSGICNLACRYDAMTTNPCRDVAKISTKPKRTPTSLSVDELRNLHQWLVQDPRSVDRDLPDLVQFLMATGLRIGEALALSWADVDVDAATVNVHGTVLRLKQVGLIVRSTPKSAASVRILELPPWAVDMLRRRQPEAMNPRKRDFTPVFPAPAAGGLRDPANTRRMLREAFRQAGHNGITSHNFRKTVATLMDDAGLSSRSAADQLGHAKPSLTADVYMGRKRRTTGAARILEDVFPV